MTTSSPLPAALLVWAAAIVCVGLSVQFPESMLLGVDGTYGLAWIVALQMPALVLGWTRSPWFGGLWIPAVIVPLVCEYPVGWVVWWQQTAPELELLAFVDQATEGLTAIVESKTLGVTTSTETVAVDRDWLGDQWTFHIMVWLLLLVPYSRPRCPVCGVPTDAKVLGWLPWAFNPRENPIHQLREAGERWCATPAPLAPRMPKGPWLSYAARCCPSGHPPVLVVRGGGPGVVRLKPAVVGSVDHRLVKELDAVSTRPAGLR